MGGYVQEQTSTLLVSVHVSGATPARQCAAPPRVGVTRGETWSDPRETWSRSTTEGGDYGNTVCNRLRVLP